MDSRSCRSRRKGGKCQGVYFGLGGHDKTDVQNTWFYSGPKGDVTGFANPPPVTCLNHFKPSSDFGDKCRLDISLMTEWVQT